MLGTIVQDLVVNPLNQIFSSSMPWAAGCEWERKDTNAKLPTYSTKEHGVVENYGNLNDVPSLYEGRLSHCRLNPGPGEHLYDIRAHVSKQMYRSIRRGDPKALSWSKGTCVWSTAAVPLLIERDMRFYKGGTYYRLAHDEPAPWEGDDTALKEDMQALERQRLIEKKLGVKGLYYEVSLGLLSEMNGAVCFN